jgi:hypothetical protein
MKAVTSTRSQCWLLRTFSAQHLQEMHLDLSRYKKKSTYLKGLKCESHKRDEQGKV